MYTTANVAAAEMSDASMTGDRFTRVEFDSRVASTSPARPPATPEVIEKTCCPILAGISGGRNSLGMAGTIWI